MSTVAVTPCSRPAGVALRRYLLRFVALGYLAAILVGPLAMVFWRTFENGIDAAWAAIVPRDVERLQADTADHADRGAAQHRVRHRRRARDRPAPVPGQGAAERVHRPSARAVAGRRRALAVSPLRSRGMVRRLARAERLPGALRAAGDGARDGVRVAAVRRTRGHADAPRDRRRAGAGGANARRLVAGRRSGGSRFRRSDGP